MSNVVKVVVQAIINQWVRVQDMRTKEWYDEERNGSKVADSRVVSIQMVGHIPASVWNSTKLAQDGQISGADLLAKHTALCSSQGIEPRLNVDTDATYVITRQKNADTNKMETFRHSGYNDRNTGEFVPMTYVKLEIPRPQLSGYELEM